MDYAVFVAGILLWLTALLCVRSRPVTAGLARWSGLPAIALLLGAAQFVDVFSENLGATPLLSLVGTVLNFASLALFAGVARSERGWPRVLHRIVQALLWLLPAPLITASMIWTGPWQPVVAGLLGLVAAGWAWRTGSTLVSGRLGWASRLGLASLALAAGLCMPWWQAPAYDAGLLIHVHYGGHAFALLGGAVLLLRVYRFGMRRDGARGAAVPLRGWGIPAFLVAFLALGYAITAVEGYRAEHSLSTTLLDRTAALASRMDSTLLDRLTFTAADEGTPAYVRLRQQLIALGQLYPSRSLYTMIHRDGQFYFGPDNLPPDDPMAGTPGELYLIPPPELSASMDAGRPILAGPYTDAYGRFVSCFAPVHDFRSHEVIAFIGQDITEATLVRAVATARLVPMAGLLLVLALLLVVWHLLQWRAATTGKHWLRHAEVGLTLLTGLMLTMGLAYASQEQERQERYAVFRQLAETGADAVFGEFFDIRRDLATLAGYFEGSDHVSAVEFRAFTRALVRQTTVDFYAWVPVVPGEARAAWEAAATRELGHAFEIWETDPAGVWQPAAERPAYFPVWLTTADEGQMPLAGKDLGMVAACGPTIHLAAASGLCTATPAFNFQPAGVQSLSLAAFHPVYEGAESPANRARLLGFVAAVVHLPELLERALDATSARHGRLHAGLVDYSVGTEPKVLATYAMEQTSLEAWLAASPSYLSPEIYVDPLPVFGRAYAVVATPRVRFWGHALLGRTALLFGGGLLLTGLLAGFVAYARHERLQLEARVQRRTEALRESEAMFHQVFESATDAISLLRDGQFADCNTATLRFLGIDSKAGLLGKRPADISPPRQPDGRASEEKAEAMIGAAIDAGHHSFEWVHTRADGSTVLAEVMLTPVTVLGELSMMAVWRDITERQKAQEAKLALERHVLERQKLESLGILAGGIAHDFNNILMAILGYAELALEQVTDVPPVEEDLRQIMAAARRAADLCAQMLAYSGKGAIRREPVQLYDLIQEMNDLLRLSISKKVHFEMDVSPVPPVLGDASQLGQVLLNLIINASEAMEGREGSVTVRLLAREEDGTPLPVQYFDRDVAAGPYAQLIVQDTGCGMDEATRKRIFEPFFTTKFTGRGLGLAAVLGIVHAHHGTMGLETAPGAGTTFYVLLPTMHAACDPGAGENLEVQPTPVPLDRACILVVDDEPQVLTVAAKTLGRGGYEVLTANGGREAVERFRTRPDDISLVILDLTMPDIDGLETVPLLRAINPHVRVVLASGYSRDDISERLGAESIQGMLQKPYSRRDLLELVARILEG